MHGVNGNFSFSYSFSQSSSYSYSSDGKNQKETLETSNHSTVSFESNGNKEPADSIMRGKRPQLRDNQQEHAHSRPGARKRHDHDHSHQFGYGQVKNTERAIKIVEKALEKGYAELEAKIKPDLNGNSINSHTQASPIAAYAQIAGDKSTAETVSDNIVGFIANKAAQVKDEGGTQADIKNILDQGLAGFEQGFSEAKEQIKGLGILDEDVNTDIGKTFDLVLAGIDNLKQQYLTKNSEDLAEENEPVEDELAGLHIEENDKVVPEVIPTSTKAVNAVDDVTPKNVRSQPVVEENRSVSTNDTKDINNNPFADIEFATQGSQSLSYASFDALDFQLVTKDGDIVTLNFSDVEAYGQQIDFGLNSEQSLSSAFFKNTEFSIDVEGELDSDEIFAIRESMNQVKKLASEFFTGNPQKAFERALDLGFNTDEIAEYSLNMTSIDVIKIESSYGAIANMNPESANSTPFAKAQESVHPFKELSSYINVLMDALHNSQDLVESSFLADAMRSIEATSQLEITNNGETHNISGFTDFNEKLLETLT